MPTTKGISATNRHLLDQLHRGVRGPFTPATAAKLWAVPLSKSRSLLAYLVARKWLARVRRGLYITVPLGATEPSGWSEDPWVVAAHIFHPCYIGGWTAAEHWGLTEQIFRDIAVFTAQRVRTRTVEIQKTIFQLSHQPAAMQFGTRPVWRGQTRVWVSDPSRTLVDMLDDPRLAGGARHLADMLTTYFGGEHRNDRSLIEHADKLGNRAVFKRLGFLAEHLNVAAPDLLTACSKRLSAGLSLFDPSIRRRGKIVKRWRLWVNVNLGDVARTQ